MLSEKQEQALSLLADTLKENGIEFQVAGGLAAIAYGASRPLEDIDLEIYKQDVEKVRELFKEYIVEDWNNELEGPDDQFDVWMMKLEIYGAPVDISQIEECRIKSKAGEWVTQQEVMDYELKRVEGIELPVVRKQLLIEYKKFLAREVDLEDIRQIS